MSRHNKVNPDHYHQAGRLTPDDMARERTKQRSTPSGGRQRPQKPAPPWLSEDAVADADLALGSENVGESGSSASLDTNAGEDRPVNTEAATDAQDTTDALAADAKEGAGGNARRTREGGASPGARRTREAAGRTSQGASRSRKAATKGARPSRAAKESAGTKTGSTRSTGARRPASTRAVRQSSATRSSSTGSTGRGQNRPAPARGGRKR